MRNMRMPAFWGASGTGAAIDIKLKALSGCGLTTYGANWGWSVVSAWTRRPKGGAIGARLER